MSASEKHDDERRSVADEEAVYTDLARAYEEVGSERQWTVEGAIEGCPVVLLVGPEKRGKSWMLADLAVAMATGTKWLGAFSATEQGRVLVLDGEYGPWEYARRIARLARGRGLDPAEAFAKIDYVFAGQFLLTWESELYQRVFKDVKKSQPSMVILDPLRNFLSGDENSTTDAVASFKYLVGLRQNCPVVVAHHLNKAGAMSGARAFKTRADMVIEGTDEEQPWFTTIGRGVRSGDPIGKRFTVRMEHEHDDDDRIACTRLRLRFEGDSAPRSEMSIPARRLLEELRKRSEPASANSLGKAANVLGGSVRSRALRELADLGLAVLKGEKWEVSTGEFFESIAPSNGGGR